MDVHVAIYPEITKIHWRRRGRQSDILKYVGAGRSKYDDRGKFSIMFF